MEPFKNRYCIVGVGNTRYGRNAGLSQLGHNVKAIRAAAEDAGLDISEIDGVMTKAPTSTFPMLWGQRVAEALNIVPKVAGTIHALEEGRPWPAFLDTSGGTGHF